MDKAKLLEANRLQRLIKKEEHVKVLLAKAYKGFCEVETDGCKLWVGATWEYMNGDIHHMSEGNPLNSSCDVELDGDIAKDICIRAIDLLENDIRFHEKQLEQL